MDIGSSAAPVRRFTSAPFPSTEMLGDLLPLADSPTHPHTQAYSIEVRPGDIPSAEPPAPAPTADVPPLPHTVANSPVFPTTEVQDEAHKPSARIAPRPAAVHAAQPPLPHEPRARHTQPPPAFIESRAPSSFVESRAPSSFSDSHAQGDHPRQRRKPSARPEGVPSRPMPLHVPDSAPLQAPAGALDSQQERMAEHLAVISRQESAQTRADDVPRFIGLVVMVWGVLVVLGGIIMLASGRGLYILASGLAVSCVGWLLYKLKRLALPMHLIFLLAAVAWAWSGKSVSALEALTQSAPLLIPALWMLVPSVREPLH